MEAIYTAILVALIVELRAAVWRCNKRLRSLGHRVEALEHGNTPLPHPAVRAAIGLCLFILLAGFTRCSEEPRAAVATLDTAEGLSAAIGTGFDIVPIIKGLLILGVVGTIIGAVWLRSKALGVLVVAEVAALAVLQVLATVVWIFAALLIVGLLGSIAYLAFVLWNHRKALASVDPFHPALCRRPKAPNNGT